MLREAQQSATPAFCQPEDVTQIRGLHTLLFIPPHGGHRCRIASADGSAHGGLFPTCRRCDVPFRVASSGVQNICVELIWLQNPSWSL